MSDKNQTECVYWNVDIAQNASLLTDSQRCILTSASLTQWLERDHNSVSAAILNLGTIKCSTLAMPKNAIAAPFFQRVIFLCADEKPKVWAESLCVATDDFWRSYLDCGSMPIGKKLFQKNNGITRSEFCYAKLTKKEAPCVLWPFFTAQQPELWARHSYFYHKNQPLSLTEVFLTSF